MSAFFWLLTTWFYLRYVREHPVLKSYMPVVISLGLGLMVKPMLVTLPFALLLLDFWPLRRVQTYSFLDFAVEGKNTALYPRSAGRLPYTLGSSAGPPRLLWNPKPLPLRIENAVISYVTYLYKSFLAGRIVRVLPLSGFRHFHSGNWGLHRSSWRGLSWFAWRSRHRFPYVLTGWLWFIGTLVPVIGIVQVGGACNGGSIYLCSFHRYSSSSWPGASRDILSSRPSYRMGLIFACARRRHRSIPSCATMQVRYWKRQHYPVPTRAERPGR